MEVPCVNGHFSVMGGSYHAVQEGGSAMRVMTPSGLWQEGDHCWCSPALWAAQTSKHISHILAFDSLQGLICGVHWGGSMAMLDREISFWTCFSVDWFGSLERIKAPFVQPKSTEGPPLSPSMKGPDWGNSTQNMLSLCCMIVHSLGPYPHLNILSFLLFYHLRPLLLSCHMLMLAAVAKGQ